MKILVALALTVIASQVRAQNHKVMDPEGSGVALTYNLPEGWKTIDKIYWNRALKINPMSFGMTLASDDQEIIVSYLSELSFDFASNGAKVAGKAPPERPSDYLEFNFKSVHPGWQYQTVDRQDNPIPFPYQPTIKGAVAKAFHSTLKLAFTANGVPSVENLSMNFYSIKYPTGPVTRGNWIVQGMTVVVSPTEEEDTNNQLAGQILSSAQMTPAFLEKYQKVATQILAETRAENARKAKLANQRQRTRIVYVHDGGGGGYTRRDWHKDCFILHENLRSLNTRIFNYCMGN